jgi:hypothetical protein
MSDDPNLGAAISRELPGPAFLRHYPGYDLVTWQPQGVLDDALLNQIAAWLVAVEKEMISRRRFVDLSQLSSLAIRTRHLFEFARKRAEDFTGTMSVRSALFSDDWVGFGIAQLYESLMKNTRIEVRAFQKRDEAAKWLDLPAEILSLKDAPMPYKSSAASK